MESFEERQVAKRDDGIVSEIYSIVLVLGVGLSQYISRTKKYIRTRTRVTPRFSMAGIL